MALLTSAEILALGRLAGPIDWDSVVYEINNKVDKEIGKGLVSLSQAAKLVHVPENTIAEFEDVYNSMNAYQLLTGKNQPNGYAGLDSSGIIPAALLPSFVDDVVELQLIGNVEPPTPENGDMYFNTDDNVIYRYFFSGVAGGWDETIYPEKGKIYITLNDNKSFRWGGSTMVEITASPGSTDAVPEGAVNKYWTNTRSISATLTGYVSGAGTISSSDTIISAIQKLNGNIGALTTSGVAEGSRLYYTNARAIASTLTGYTSGAGSITSSDTIIGAIQKLNGNIAALTTSNITEGSNLYYTASRFNAAFASKSTTDLSEGSNLYFTNARAIAAQLTGYVSGAGTISATDSILVAIQKLNGNIAAIPASQWITSGSNIYYSTGSVGIGLSSTPSARLHIRGTGATGATNALYIENSSGTILFQIGNDGNIGIKQAPNAFALAINGRVSIATGNDIIVNRMNAWGSAFFDYAQKSNVGWRLDQASQYRTLVNIALNEVVSNGLLPLRDGLLFDVTHTTSVGMGDNAAMIRFAHTINQTSVTQTTLSIYSIPILTSAYNYRAFEFTMSAAYSPNAAVTDYVFSKLTPNLNASVNSQIMVGLDISMSGTNGAFTNVERYGLRLNQPILLGNLSSDPAGRNGAIYYNTTTDKFRGYKAGSWVDII
jgi:hypothetical protein